jgi:site-specific DNA-methyltransferase (adenine-specific)
MIQITNEDNMELMARYEDNHFDLAIVDPPYQIERFSKNMDSQGTLGKSIFLGKNKISEWDKLPTKEYFNEIFRVSKNQIIWGANHFWQTANLPNTTNFIFWDKKMPFPNFSRGELAWTSFKGVCKCFEYNYYGNIEGNKQSKGRIHPTQKPIALYEWLLINYAQRKCEHKHEEHNRHLCTDCRNQDVKILDTHLGSGSIAIACHNLGFDLTACELDKDYYEAATKRLAQHQAQLTMF